MRVPALVLAPSTLTTPAARCTHALIRGSDRYRITAVVDPDNEGEDAGALIDHKHRGVPVVSSIVEAIDEAPATPEYCIIGTETADGRLSDELRVLVIDALKTGLSIVNPLPGLLRDDAELVALASAAKAELIDVCDRLPPGGAAHDGTTRKPPCLAIVGTDVAAGKHTTARMLHKSLRHLGLTTSAIYTGPTGWMQGGQYGVILDALAVENIQPALEDAIARCIAAEHPQLLLLETHSSRHKLDDLQLLEFGGCDMAILQHSIDAEEATDVETRLAELHAAGIEVLALAVRGFDLDEVGEEAEALQEATGLPTFRPLSQGTNGMASLIISRLEKLREHATS
jgi:uncharacterized NAD-dependent epimerase/dehydratase family protein